MQARTRRENRTCAENLDREPPIAACGDVPMLRRASRVCIDRLGVYGPLTSPPPSQDIPPKTTHITSAATRSLCRSVAVILPLLLLLLFIIAVCGSSCSAPKNAPALSFVCVCVRKNLPADGWMDRGGVFWGNGGVAPLDHLHLPLLPHPTYAQRATL